MNLSIDDFELPIALIDHALMPDNWQPKKQQPKLYVDLNLMKWYPPIKPRLFTNQEWTATEPPQAMRISIVWRPPTPPTQPGTPITPAVGRPTCSFPGCLKKPRVKTLCYGHSKHIRQCSTVNCFNIKRCRDKCAKHAGKFCKHKGCTYAPRMRGLCAAHGGKYECDVLDCASHAYKAKRCRKHFTS